MDSLLGQSVSHYSVTRKLGSGGMGVVYEAEDSRLGRRVALKFLPPDTEQDPSTPERFQREARAASALHHPNICTVYAIEQHERQPFIVMELLERRTGLFRSGTVLYQMASGQLPFVGETSAVIYEAILNRDPAPTLQIDPTLPPALDRILDKALEKDRNLRYQSATELKTDLIRLKRDLDSGHRRASEAGDSRSSAPKQTEKSIA